MKTLLQGNKAIALGAMRAGLSFFAGYPITPASEILHFLVQTKVKTVQMEDEIASIHSVIGASMAGAKAMTATSGPGFSLMQEAIGYAHMTETPCVIVDVQRAGPSTGMPTLFSQGDILQTCFGSHGDYFPIVFYPNSVEELYRYTAEAFNASEEVRGPVILLSDGYVSHLYETVDLGRVPVRERKRVRKPLGAGTRHFTGLTSKNNVPRTTDFKVHREFIKHMKRKQEETAKQYNFYEYLPLKGSDTLVISFGLLSRVIYSFADRYSLFRPIRLFPVVEDLRGIARGYEKIVVVEMNAGQYSLALSAFLGRTLHSLWEFRKKPDFKLLSGRIHKIR